MNVDIVSKKCGQLFIKLNVVGALVILSLFLMQTEPLYQFYDGYITRTSTGPVVEEEETMEHTYESLQDTTSNR